VLGKTKSEIKGLELERSGGEGKGGRGGETQLLGAMRSSTNE